MNKIRFLTQSAFVFGLMVQAGYAMDHKDDAPAAPRVNLIEDHVNLIENGYNNGMDLVAEKILIASAIVTQLDAVRFFDAPPASGPAPVMIRSGLASAEVEYAEIRKARVQTAVAANLVTWGMEQERNKVYNTLSPNDQAIVDNFLKNLEG